MVYTLLAQASLLCEKEKYRSLILHIDTLKKGLNSTWFGTEFCKISVLESHLKSRYYYYWSSYSSIWYNMKLNWVLWKPTRSVIDIGLSGNLCRNSLQIDSDESRRPFWWILVTVSLDYRIRNFPSFTLSENKISSWETGLSNSRDIIYLCLW